MANGNMKAERKPVTVTARSGCAVIFNGLHEIDGMIVGNLQMRTTSTLSARTWVAIGDTNKPPASDVEVPWVSTSTGAWGGILQITTYGVIRLYPVEQQSGTGIGSVVSYPYSS